MKFGLEQVTGSFSVVKKSSTFRLRRVAALAISYVLVLCVCCRPPQQPIAAVTSIISVPPLNIPPPDFALPPPGSLPPPPGTLQPLPPHLGPPPPGLWFPISYHSTHVLDIWSVSYGNSSVAHDVDSHSCHKYLTPMRLLSKNCQ